jgi:effector-binding domain-containing protein
MKKALGYLGVALVVLAVLAVAGTFLLPREAHVERSVAIARPPCTVYALVDGWGRFTAWSPWSEQDPSTTYEYSGPAEGVGAAMSWKSEELGDGAQQITAAKDCESVDVTVAFEGMGESPQTWRLEARDGGTVATWGMTVELGNNPLMRVMGTQMDSMIGPDFDRGLAKLKALAETLPPTDFAGLAVERVELPAGQVAALATAAPKDPMAVGAALGTAYARIRGAVEPLGLTIAGPPRASYLDDGDQWQIRATIPYTGTATAAPGDPAVTVEPGWSGAALKVVHVGPYAGLGETWAKVEAWTAAHGVKASAARWEEYASDPSLVPADQLQTNLYVPLK